MKIIILLFFTVTLACMSVFTPELLPQRQSILQDMHASGELKTLLATGQTPLESSVSFKPMHDVELLLQQKDVALNPNVIHKIVTTLNCAHEYQVGNQQVLVVIDYSLPSSEKRLWVFDLVEKKLLYHTYVSHGLRSGVLTSSYFSNKNNSKSSSLGVYKTEQVYYGRHGLSLKLLGLDHGFNDNAENRSVVMHGGWYVDEDFIKKYGRAGRSWGCPAVPENLKDAIINTIKDNALFVVYYPSDDWFIKSKFLNCERVAAPPALVQNNVQPALPSEEPRENVLFANMSKHSKIDDTPIVAVKADDYARIFHNRVPLERMLRRQINSTEYVALSNIEFNTLIHSGASANDPNDDLNTLCFVQPVVKMDRGYYGTEMKLLNMGKIKEIKPHESMPSEQTKSFTVYFESNSTVNLSSTNQFIRWLGL